MYNEIKDIVGKDAKPGDTVVFNVPKYKLIDKGVIKNLTPKGIRVEYFDRRYNKMDTTFVASNQFVLVEDNPKPVFREIPVQLGQKVFTKENGTIKEWFVYNITLNEYPSFI